MEIARQREMRKNYADLSKSLLLSQWQLYVFGHTEATGQLLSMVRESGGTVLGILDNNKAKQGTIFEGVPIMAPQELCQGNTKKVLVLIASRAYAAMFLQLRENGFQGRVVKLVDYNTFAEYELSDEVIDRRLKRERRGEEILSKLQAQIGRNFLVICPFKALGDVCYAMKYLEDFRQKKAIGQVFVAVAGNSCAETVKLYYDMPVFSFAQQDMDELVQAVLFRQPENVLIVHHDRPYSNYMIRLLCKLPIHFEELYKLGIYGLTAGGSGQRPRFWQECQWESIPKGSSVILMPYAKSVVNLPGERWKSIVEVLTDKGLSVFSSVQGDEVPLVGTKALQDVPVCLMKSLVEWAGGFISIRNGLCDILQDADCRKIILYPDACYSDTPWPVIKFFELSGCDSVIFKGDGRWEVYNGGENRPFDFAEDLDF